MTTAEDHAREVVKDTLGIDLLPYQLVERDAEGRTYRTGRQRWKFAVVALRFARIRNDNPGWRPDRSRWWAVMGPEGWVQ